MGIEISNSDDLIDSRDVIARIEELATEVEACSDCGGTGVIDNPDTRQDECESCFDARLELMALRRLATDAEGYAADWTHGETMIRDSYFPTYAQELAADIGAIDAHAHWPLNCIDWDEAARELQQDYTSVDFDGVTYWVR